MPSAFFCALAKTELNTLENYIKQYINDPSSNYLITHEVSKTAHIETQGSHFHLYIDGSFNYDAFRKTVLVKYYSLQGQARNGVGRQYGKIKDIRNVIEYCRYCCKDQDEDYIVETCRYRGYTSQDIINFIHESYKKENYLSLYQKLIIYLK